MASAKRVSSQIIPTSGMGVLSQYETSQLKNTSEGGIHQLFRQCSLAVLTGGNETDDPRILLQKYKDFDIKVIPQARGIKLEVINAPPEAFVDGRIIESIRENLFAVLRDIIYIHNKLNFEEKQNLGGSEIITNEIFHILKNAEALKPVLKCNRIVCWGGHAVNREEYEYSKQVGYELGLRGLDIITGCGTGVMKGPMKGARVGHAKQRIYKGEYVGLTEPEIIAAEAPNPVVNRLVIMPDIEKRLEAFVRLGHGFIVFPGGVGTAEEILYLLGVLLTEENQEMPFPLIFTGPKKSEFYFRLIDDFIAATLGREAQEKYEIVIGDPKKTAYTMKKGVTRIRRYRKKRSDAYYFNWLLEIKPVFQERFIATHESMERLRISKEQGLMSLAVNLRRAFSGIVAGNVKEDGIRRIEEYGPFRIQGDSEIMGKLDELLRSFVRSNRMKLNGRAYEPCYEIIMGRR